MDGPADVPLEFLSMPSSRRWRAEEFSRRLQVWWGYPEATVLKARPGKNTGESALAFDLICRAEDGSPLAGVQLVKKAREQKEGKEIILASSDLEGRLCFDLAPDDETLVLEAVYGRIRCEIHRGSFENNEILRSKELVLDTRKIEPGYIWGRIMDRWGDPLEGVELSRSASGNVEAVSEDREGTFPFSHSARDGSFVFADLEVGSDHEIVAKTSGNTQNFFIFQNDWRRGAVELQLTFPESGPPPLTWRGRIEDMQGRPMRDQALSDKSFGSFSEALSSGQFILSDMNGEFSLGKLKPGSRVDLYLYHTKLGKVKLESHLFLDGKDHESLHRLETDSRIHAGLCLRLQDEQGVEIREGWVATSPVYSDDNLQDVLRQGGFGMRVSSAGETCIEGLPPFQRTVFHYANSAGQSFELGEWRLQAGELHRAGILRTGHGMRGEGRTAYAAVIIHPGGYPAKGVRVEAIDASGLTLARAICDGEGYFELLSIPNDTRVSIIASSAKGSRALCSQKLLDQEFTQGGIFVFDPLPPLSLCVSTAPELILQDAKLSLHGEELCLQGLGADPFGEFSLGSLLDYGRPLSLAVFRPGYRPVFQSDWVRQADYEPANLSLEALEKVKVRLCGPDFSERPFVRAWVGYQEGGEVVIDSLPDNETAAPSNDGLLCLRVHRDRPFYLFVGLPRPWPDALYGPLEPVEGEPLELHLQKSTPLVIELVGAPLSATESWRMELLSLPGPGMLEARVFEIEVKGPISPPLFLAEDVYAIVMKSRYFKDQEIFVRGGGGERTIEVATLPKEDRAETPGQPVRNFLISDAFPLCLASEGSGRRWAGFSLDWLLHLGGEAVFRARHLDIWPDLLDQSQQVSWRSLEFPDGVLDFRDTRLFPAQAGNYAVSYAQFTASFPLERKFRLNLSATGGLKVWLDGRLIFSREGGADFNTGAIQEFRDITLGPKLKRFTVKCSNWKGPWLLQVGFRDLEGDGIPELGTSL
ncbi:MAG: hypothetical protein HQL31_01845 [Planctomycetes bacterium]|nr:hypothetical protein [Planctomycetota bacterium]